MNEHEYVWEDLMSAMSAVLGVDDEAIDLATDLLEAIQPHIYREVRDAALLAKVRAIMEGDDGWQEP